MKAKFCNPILGVGLVIATIALPGCGTPAAKNFSGHWKPVNHFLSQPTEIPLHAAYTFYASPMDETLKNMLTRWANDSGRKLSYQLSFDVTLYTPVSSIRTIDVGSAVQQLSTIYAAQHLRVSATDQEILVSPAGMASPDVAPQTSTAAIPTPAQPARKK